MNQNISRGFGILLDQQTDKGSHLHLLIQTLIWICVKPGIVLGELCHAKLHSDLFMKWVYELQQIILTLSQVTP